VDLLINTQSVRCQLIMKKLLFVGLLALVSLFGPYARSQDIPKCSWQVEPSYPEFKEDIGRGHWEVRDIQIVWDDDSNLFAHSSEDGGITNIVFHTIVGGQASVFAFPAKDEKERFSALEQWRKFAERARTRCRFLTEGMYVDTVAYECVGKSRVLRDWEFGRGTEHLVFKDGNRLVVVSLDDWEGTEPKKGEKIFLGRHKGHDTFFPVEKVGEKYLIEPRTAEVLAELVRRKEEALAEPKEAPVPTLPKIVVEGRLPEK